MDIDESSGLVNDGILEIAKIQIKGRKQNAATDQRNIEKRQQPGEMLTGLFKTNRFRGQIMMEAGRMSCDPSLPGQKSDMRLGQ